MQITDTARDLLANAITQADKKGIILLVRGEGCHSQLLMDYVDSVELAEEINGVQVVMDANTNMILENCILDTNEDGLLLRNLGGCGGGCGGCGEEGCGDGGCGGGCCEA